MSILQSKCGNLATQPLFKSASLLLINSRIRRQHLDEHLHITKIDRRLGINPDLSQGRASNCPTCHYFRMIIIDMEMEMLSYAQEEMHRIGQ